MASLLHISLPPARSASFISEIVHSCQHRQQQSVCCSCCPSTSTSASSSSGEAFAIANAKNKGQNSAQSWIPRSCSRWNANVVNNRISINSAGGGVGSSSGFVGARPQPSGDSLELVSGVCRPSLNLGGQGKKKISVSAAAGADLAEAADTGTDKEQEQEQEKEGELPEKLLEIVRLFQEVKDPRAKYEQLLYYAKRLRPLAKEFCTKENKVEGCVSQVWVRPSLNAEESTVASEADSDSVLTKGLAALLVEGLSGAKVAEVLKVSPEFVQMLGLKQSLTPSRSNGFLNMLKLMQKKTLQMYMQAEAAKLSSSSSSSSSAAVGVGTAGKAREEGRAASSSVNAMDTRSVSGMSKNGANFAPDAGPGKQTSRKSSIEKKLQEALAPTVLVVEDVSHQHAGHAGVHKDATETHFNVKVVSDKFSGTSLIKRHRLIYNLLDDEIKNGVHALSLVTKSPSEPV